MKEDEQAAARLDAVFPCILKILPTCIFNKKDPIVLGVDVIEGIAKVCCRVFLRHAAFLSAPIAPVSEFPGHGNCSCF